MKIRVTSQWYVKEARAHQRALATPMRPSHIPANVEAKASDYAVWLMLRDKPLEAQWEACQGFVSWDHCEAGKRPRFVELSENGKTRMVVEIPHWDFIEKPPVEIVDSLPAEEQLSFL